MPGRLFQRDDVGGGSRDPGGPGAGGWAGEHVGGDTCKPSVGWLKYSKIAKTT